MALSAAVRPTQSIAREFVPDGVGLADEPTAGRRAEAAHERQAGSWASIDSVK